VTEYPAPGITVSIVSHGQGKLVATLLRDLVQCSGVTSVLVTMNIPEDEIETPADLRSRIVVIRNEAPKGFAANHNQAFKRCTTPCFAVLNPDLRLTEDPFASLAKVQTEMDAGIIAPSVRAPDGTIEDSVRDFPTLGQLLGKLLGLGDGSVALDGDHPQPVDWAAGMFLLFQSESFRKFGGFDEGFFLYYEDVDICVRMWKGGSRVVLHPGVSVIHEAQRASRRKIRYMRWHLASMARYFVKHAGRLPRTALH
jgi:N-acetylglucosaminyl-diphospho-decaprenol L-rhamnosyltransferase